MPVKIAFKCPRDGVMAPIRHDFNEHRNRSARELATSKRRPESPRPTKFPVEAPAQILQSLSLEARLKFVVKTFPVWPEYVDQMVMRVMELDSAALSRICKPQT
jgi:hypothetical protein